MVGDFERLAQEFLNPDAQMHYRICGELDRHGRPRLRCKVKGDVEMLCQRCLQPVHVAVESDRLLYLASSEGEAERLETTLADEDFEVMVTDRTLDLAGVVEDEVLLSLPIVPMHADCSAEISVDI